MPKKDKPAKSKPNATTAKDAGGDGKSGKKKAGKKKHSGRNAAVVTEETEKLLSSKVVYQGPLFRILHDKLLEPGGRHSERDVIRHNGSVVILAIDTRKSKKNPWI